MRTWKSFPSFIYCLFLDHCQIVKLKDIFNMFKHHAWGSCRLKWPLCANLACVPKSLQLHLACSRTKLKAETKLYFRLKVIVTLLKHPKSQSQSEEVTNQVSSLSIFTSKYGGSRRDMSPFKVALRWVISLTLIHETSHGLRGL